MSKETCEYLSESDKGRFRFEENTDLETRKGTKIEGMTTFFVSRKTSDGSQLEKLFFDWQKFASL